MVDFIIRMSRVALAAAEESTKERGLIQLNYRDTKPIYEQVKEGIRRLVIIGAILPGEPVTPVLELSSRLAINPTAIGRAYRELEEEGYLRTATDGVVLVTSIDRRKSRRDELFDEFDSVVRSLRTFSVSEEELSERVRLLMNGGMHDTGKPCD